MRGLKDKTCWFCRNFSACWCGKVGIEVGGSQLEGSTKRVGFVATFRLADAAYGHSWRESASGPPCQPQRRAMHAPWTWSIGILGPVISTSCGLRTSPTCPPRLAGSTSPSSPKCAREILGWKVASSLHTDVALDALNMAICQRRRDDIDTRGLVHHSDRGVQYRDVRYGQALARCQAVASVGSTGSYDNALAEALNSLYKAELIDNEARPGYAGPWRDRRGRTRSRRLGPLVQHPPPPLLSGRHHATTSRKPTHNNTKGSGRNKPP